MGEGNICIQIRHEMLCCLVKLGHSGVKPLLLLKNVNILSYCVIYRQATYICTQHVSEKAALILESLLTK